MAAIPTSTSSAWRWEYPAARKARTSSGSRWPRASTSRLANVRSASSLESPIGVPSRSASTTSPGIPVAFIRWVWPGTQYPQSFT